jgi:ribosomal protein S18 acetylase RimI-like enzyme
LTRSDLPRLLPVVAPAIDARYPGGGRWAVERLDAAVDGRARATVLAVPDRVVALAVETPKGRHAAKLSTLWVHPAHRHRGHAGALLAHLARGWRERGLERVILTAAETLTRPLSRVLEPVGFRSIAVEVGRYGDGRDERVFTWIPEPSAAIAPPG